MNHERHEKHEMERKNDSLESVGGDLSVREFRDFGGRKSINHERHEKHESERDLIFRDECFAIQGAVFDVYRELGSGFLEAVYQECLEKEFQLRKIPFVAQQRIPLYYKGEQLQQVYKPDFTCYNAIILELKAVKDIAPEHKAQVLNYLKATNLKLGLLINFGAYPKATVARLVL